VGIGTSSPATTLQVTNTSATTNATVTPVTVQAMTSGTAANGFGSSIEFNAEASDGTSYAQTTISSLWTDATAATRSSALTFATRTSAGAVTERARIDTSGNLLVGTTSLYTSDTRLTSVKTASGKAAAFATSYSSDAGEAAVYIGKFDNVNTTGQLFVRFLINNAAIGNGQINANGASQAAFGSYSDRRLKENITDLQPQLANIMALRPVEFDYIESEGGGHQISFIAQEFETVYPDAVGERQDGMKTLTGWSKTEARLVKAIQEQQALITQLQADVAALKGASA
jgi:hypothetical protein